MVDNEIPAWAAPLATSISDLWQTRAIWKDGGEAFTMQGGYNEMMKRFQELAETFTKIVEEGEVALSSQDFADISKATNEIKHSLAIIELRSRAHRGDIAITKNASEFIVRETNGQGREIRVNLDL